MNNKISEDFTFKVGGSVEKMILSKVKPDLARQARNNLNLLKISTGKDVFILSATSKVDDAFGGLTRKTLTLRHAKKTIPLITVFCDNIFSKHVSSAIDNLACYIKDLTPETILSFKSKFKSVKKP